MFKRLYFGFCLLLFFTVLYLAVITFKPITKVYPEDVILVTGTVSLVSLGEGGDINIKLKENSHNFYINRAFQNGLQLDKLKQLLQEKKVNLWHIKRWTPFTRDKVFPHISKLTYRDSIIFNEIITTNGKK